MRGRQQLQTSQQMRVSNSLIEPRLPSNSQWKQSRRCCARRSHSKYPCLLQLQIKSQVDVAHEARPNLRCVSKNQYQPLIGLKRISNRLEQPFPTLTVLTTRNRREDSPCLEHQY